MSTLETVRERIHRLGPLPFDEVVELALYGPDGFYERTGRGAGRAADFLTSPEVGPLFGAVLARALDHWWDDLGAPDPYVVVEAGAGPGTLARDVLRAAPRCAGALHYVLVERSEAQRARQAGVLPLEPAATALGPVLTTDPDEGARPARGTGPVVVSLAEFPAGPQTGVVIANELLDNLPFRLLQKRNAGWDEIRVAEDGGHLVELAVPADPAVADEAARLAPSAADGARIPLQHAAAAWLRSTLSLLDRGRVVTLDYADTTAGMAARPQAEWLRTYRGHAPGGPPLEHLGEQDITCDVALDQLAAVRAPAVTGTQEEFLRAHGLDELREEAAVAWQARASVGDLEAVKARSRAFEAVALADAAGLGGFRVVEWAVERRA